MLKLREGRELSHYGSYGIDRQLQHMRNTAWVCWLDDGVASYVATQQQDGKFLLHSINGIGEIRWSLDPQSPFGEGDSRKPRAIAYFFEEVS